MTLLLGPKTYPDFFGMPGRPLTWLVVIGLGCFIFSASCFLLLKQNRTPFITCIAAANTVYSLVALLFVAIHYQQLTSIALVYFLAELVILALII